MKTTTVEPSPAFKKLAGDVLLYVDPDAIKSCDYLSRVHDLAIKVQDAIAANDAQRISDPDRSLLSRLSSSKRTSPLRFPLNVIAPIIRGCCYVIIALPAFILVLLEDEPLTPGEQEAKRVEKARQRRHTWIDGSM